MLIKKIEEEILNKVKNRCIETLSNVSVPTNFCLLEELPMTAAGKTDYKRLEELTK